MVNRLFFARGRACQRDDLFDTGNHDDKILGLIVVVAVAAILFWTVKKWAKWFCIACSVYVFRAAVMALLGRTVSVPSMPVNRISFLAIAGFLAIMSYLTYRFVSGVPTRLDSFCLVGAVLAIVHSLVGNTPVWSASVAFFLLLIAFAVDRVLRKGPAPENL